MEILIFPFLTAFLATCFIYPKVLRIALDKNIVDNPDARKLQRVPVPVLGGAPGFFGVIAGLCCAGLFVDCSTLLPVVASMVIILMIGIIDDIINLSPRVRLMIEILLVLYLGYATGNMIDDFHGLWGIHGVSAWLSVPLTIVAGVGIINAINLIDGVDGLSSGFCIQSCLLFGTVFYLCGDTPMLVLAVLCVAALLPFFFHNVFGLHSKMFIGDGGTLVMGVLAATFVMRILSSQSPAAFYGERIGLIPFTLAVMCIPVFDTLRVMTARIVRGHSPFKPDKTHLHHLFIDLGFSHIGTTVSILTLNLLVVVVWWISFRCGALVELQFYIVLVMSVLFTFVFYRFMRLQIKGNTRIYRFMNAVGRKTHIKHQGCILRLQRYLDRVVRPREH